MATQHTMTAVVAVIGVAALIVAVTHAGPLTPPAGPVAPTYKTLAEVEPRVAVQSLAGDAEALHVISQPGSYYLTGNITGVAGKFGIKITANNVTLDLRGFELVGVPGSFAGVYSTGSHGAVRNGTVRNWGEYGLATNTAARVEDVWALNNALAGISASGGVVNHCTAIENGEEGIWAPGAAVTGCVAQANGTIGIRGAGAVIANCVVIGNGTDGIVANGVCTISACTVFNNQHDGIELTGSGCLVIGNTCTTNGLFANKAGIHVVTLDDRIEGNNVINSPRGIDVDVPGNLVIRNSASGNTTNYDIVPGNFVGTIVTTEAAMNAAANGNVNIAF